MPANLAVMAAGIDAGDPASANDPDGGSISGGGQLSVGGEATLNAGATNDVSLENTDNDFEGTVNVRQPQPQVEGKGQLLVGPASRIGEGGSQLLDGVFVDIRGPLCGVGGNTVGYLGHGGVGAGLVVVGLAVLGSEDGYKVASG